MSRYDANPILVRKVAAVVGRRLDLPGRRLDPTARLVDDLGADSLAVVEITLALEEAFDIDIEDESIETLHTIGDAVEHVRRALSRRAS